MAQEISSILYRSRRGGPGRGGVLGVYRIAGLPTTAAGFDMIQNHVDLLSGKVHAVPARATATAADAAEIIRDLCLRAGTGFSDVLVVDHGPKFTSEVFRAFVKGMGSSLQVIVGSAYHNNTNAKVGSGPMAQSSAIRCAPSPTRAKTTETASCPLQSSQSILLIRTRHLGTA